MKNSFNKGSHVNNSTLALALLLSSSAWAQASSSDIEQITITSSINSRSLLDLDSNLSVVNSDELELIKHEHINQALVRVPGGWISRGNGQEHLTAIRSPVLTGAGGCGAFFMAQDGISLRAPGFCNTNQLFDVNSEQAQRIEVLRGPSSTRFGSNAVHGVINVISPDAFDYSRASVGLSAGPHDYYGGEFSVGEQWGEQALLVFGNGQHDGGYKDDSGFAQQKFNLVHQFQDQLWSVKSVIAATNLNQETAGFIQGEQAYKDSSLKKQNPNPEAFRDSQSFRAYSEIYYQKNDQTRLRFTPFVRWTSMKFLQHYVPWQPVEKNGQRGIGFKAAVEHKVDDSLWLLGLDTDITEGTLIEDQSEEFSPTLPAGRHYDYKVNAEVYSPYIQAQWSITENLHVNAGLRYEKTRYDYNNHLSDGSACESNVDNCRFTRPESQQVDYDELSYQLGGHYNFAPLHRVYGQFSTGYRAPQATELFRLQAGQTVADLDAEQLDSLELGVRGQWDNFSYDVTAFTMKKDDFIFQDTNRQNISNGKTVHHGVEFLFSYQLPYNFYVKANGTIANHKYDSSLTLSRVDIKGNEIDTAPQHMGSAQLGWYDGNSKTIELEWLHLGNYYLNPENTAEYSGHNLLNLRLNAEIGNNWVVNARVLNLLDEDYAERADFGFGNYRYFVGEPRSLFVSIKYNFE